MPKQKLTDQRIARLIELGFTELETRATKYRTFIHPMSKLKIFVGKNGSARKGTRHDSSYSITDIFEQAIKRSIHLFTPNQGAK